MATTGVSSQRLTVVALSLGFISAPVAYGISILMDWLSSPDDGANIGAGFFLLLATGLFVWATVAFVVVLALGRLTTSQVCAWRPSPLCVSCWSVGCLPSGSSRSLCADVRERSFFHQPVPCQVQGVIRARAESLASVIVSGRPAFCKPITGTFW